MDIVERPSFPSTTGKRIYEYVERHGTAKRHVLQTVVDVPSEEFSSELDRLKSKGYLEEDGGTLTIALDVGAIEEYETPELVFAIRPARREDFEGIIDTIRAVTAEDTYVVAETVAEQLLYEDTINRHNTVQSRVFFVAIIEDEVAGWAHLDLPQLAAVHETCQLTVGVKDPYRGKGIGSRLLRRGLEWAQANGYRKVYNTVPVTNDRAIEFLRDHDWEVEATRPEHYTIDGEYVDEVIMAYRF